MTATTPSLSLPSIVQGNKLKILLDYAMTVKDLPGDIAEVGVHRGGVSLALSVQHPYKTVHMFDTFSGMPIQGEGDQHKIGEFQDCNFPAIKRAFEGRLYQFHIGVFPDTCSELRNDQTFCFVHVDGDQYQTTRDAIDYFWPRLTPGGILIFDDYEWPMCPGVTKAILETFSPLVITRPTSSQA